jgi:hypothetical protein
MKMTVKNAFCSSQNTRIPIKFAEIWIFTFDELVSKKLVLPNS